MKIKAMFTLYKIDIRGGGGGRVCLRDFLVGMCRREAGTLSLYQS